MEHAMQQWRQEYRYRIQTGLDSVPAYVTDFPHFHAW